MFRILKRWKHVNEHAFVYWMRDNGYRGCKVRRSKHLSVSCNEVAEVQKLIFVA